MTRLSVSGLWSEAAESVRRNAAAILPVAAAFMFLPQVMQAAVVGPQAVPTEPTGTEVLFTLVGGLLSLFGQLVIAAILMGRVANVRAGFADAWSAVPRVLRVIGLFFAVIIVFALTSGILVAAVAGLGAVQTGKVPPALLVLLLPLLLLVLWVGSRLLPLFEVLLDVGTGGRASVARAWGMTAQAQGTLFGFSLSFLAALLFAAMVAQLAAGTVFPLLLGRTALAHLLTATVVSAVATFFGLLSTGAAVAAWRALR